MTITILTIIFGIALLSFLVLLAIFIHLHNFSIPTKKIKTLAPKPKSKVLAIFPHPDDETMSSGGLIAKLVKKGHIVKAISMTHGEAGNELLDLPEKDIANIRKKEFEKAVSALGVTTYKMWHFKDGKLPDSKRELKAELQEELKNFNPDLIVTFEKFGLYGHKDHMVLSEVLNDLGKQLHNTKVIFSTITKAMFERYDLPTHMGEIERPSDPEFKIFTGMSAWRKYKAAKAYKSQRLARGIPLFLIILLGMYEYYTTKYD